MVIEMWRVALSSIHLSLTSLQPGTKLCACLWGRVSFLVTFTAYWGEQAHKEYWKYENGAYKEGVGLMQKRN